MDLEKIKQSPNFVGCVPSGTLDMLPNKHKGDIIYTTDHPKKVMLYDGEKWIEINSLPNQTINTGMSLLELNRSAITNMPYKAAYDFKDESYNILNDIFHKAKEYLMLYGKEISYFTIFRAIHNLNEEYLYDDFSRAFLDCLDNIGKVYSIEYADETKQAIEIWVKTPEGKTTVLYLFPYDDGIVTVKY